MSVSNACDGKRAANEVTGSRVVDGPVAAERISLSSEGEMNPPKPTRTAWHRRAARWGSASVLLLCAAVPAHANLIANGDFSTLVPSNGTGGGWNSTHIDTNGGWRSTGGNPLEHFILNDDGNSASDPTISQSVTGLSVGTTYTLSWESALHFNSFPNGTSFGAFLDGAVLKLTENLLTSFVADSVNFVATATTHTISFAAELDTRTPGVSSASNVSYRIDNISLVAASSVPEPETIALLVLGLLALIWHRASYDRPTHRAIT